MGFFDFLKKKKQEAEPETVAENVMGFGDVDPSEIQPPETRFTQEYQDFLASQEAGARGRNHAVHVPPVSDDDGSADYTEMNAILEEDADESDSLS